jgi:hypothetical protein
MADTPIHFTKHARQKFVDLAEMGFVVTEQQVIDTVQTPEHIDRSADPPIAQKTVSENHVLRVVFAEDNSGITIITFYPARRSRYVP